MLGSVLTRPTLAEILQLHGGFVAKSFISLHREERVMLPHGLRLVACALALVIVAGCGGSKVKRVNVSGTVTLDGQPVPHGTISFTPADKTTQGNTAGGEITEGKYSVANVTPGKNRVEISDAPPQQQPKTYEEYARDQSKAMAGAMNRQAAMREKKEVAASRRVSSDSIGNGQIIDISPDGQDGLNIKLESAKSK
jgi:hypothetical protein